MSTLRLGVFVSESEEAFHVSASPMRRRHPYAVGGGFVVQSVDGMKWIRSLGLSGRAHDVLSLMCERALANNLVSVRHQWVADELGMNRPEVSRLIGALRDHGVLWRLPSDGGGVWRIAPRLLWKGNPKDLPEALTLYGRALSPVKAGVVSLRAKARVVEVHA